MNNIVTTSEVQKNIGKISNSISENSYIVTNRGKGKIVMLPYFDGCNEIIDEYMEDFEMLKNHKILKQKYKDSHSSGLSNLVV